MSAPSPHERLQTRFRLSRGYRLQWEAAQDAHVLLFPEGMVKLNGSAAQILLRCDGQVPLRDVVADLERQFDQPDLTHDVCQFVEFAQSRGWLEATS